MPVPVHNPTTPEEEDLVDRMLSKSGCAEMHYKLQECMAEHKDWRKCQDAVRVFRDCINAYEQRKRSES